MKSQLLQSCRGQIGPIPTFPKGKEHHHRSPIPAFPKGKEQHHNILKLSGNAPAPWGGPGRGFQQGLRLPLNHLLPIADIDAGRQRVPVLRHLDALQRVDALLAGGYVGVYGAYAYVGGLYD